jgi:very-short-patch-repair endonuclease
MATKKKSFDAVAESRRWRIATGRKLRGLSFEEQQALLRRTTEAFFAEKPKHCASALARR